MREQTYSEKLTYWTNQCCLQYSGFNFNIALKDKKTVTLSANFKSNVTT